MSEISELVDFEERVGAEVKRQTQRLQASVDAQAAEIKELKALAGLYQSARETPIKIPSWQLKPHSGGHVGIVVAQMADWHLDENVRPEEILNLNAYSPEIAMIRAKLWMEKVITLPRDYVNGLKIEGLVIPSTGDLFTGEIHPELKESNGRRILASLLYWMEPVIGIMLELEKAYGNVVVHAVPGNHGRLSEKPVFKGRVDDNVEPFFWSIIKARLGDLGSKVIVNVSPSMDLNVPIYGRNYLLTHGDQFKGGTGISGAFAPLSLGSHRKDKRQRIAGMPMQTMVIGHLHQLINIPGVIMGGTMKGYDEYAFGINAQPDPDGASQAMWITTPERAQTIWMPIYLQDRKAEGW